MKDEVVLQKLDSLVRCIERLKEKKPSSLKELETNPDLQDIIILNLERLVQMSVDIAFLIVSKRNLKPIPSTMAGSFDVLKQQNIITTELCNRLQKAVGFRNLCVHEYDKINWKIVETLLSIHLIDFVQFGKVVENLTDS